VKTSLRVKSSLKLSPEAILSKQKQSHFSIDQLR
jgi:hypothetical protein